MTYEYNDDDFGSARPGHFLNVRDYAFAIADEAGLSGVRAERFAQGYVHAAQGRIDLVGRDVDYDCGHKEWLK